MQDSRNASWQRYAVYTLIVVVVLLLILILFLYLIRSPLIFRSGASTLIPSVTQGTGQNLSLANSYIFASPLRAKAGGEKIRITVYILDDRGIGIIGKNVTLGAGSQIIVTPIQPTTDSQGRATFDIASAASPGVFLIQASVDGATLTQKATVSFD
jgi:hypothetical protein